MHEYYLCILLNNGDKKCYEIAQNVNAGLGGKAQVVMPGNLYFGSKMWPLNSSC